jgi:hypothetical protein
MSQCTPSTIIIWCVHVLNFIYLFCFVVLEFELRASCWLDRHFITWATPPAIPVVFSFFFCSTGLELRTSHLLGKLSTTSATLPATIWWLKKKKKSKCQAPVAHACNSSYSESRDQEDRSSKPAWANSSYFETLSQKPFTRIGLVEWLKAKILSSSLNTTKKKSKKKKNCWKTARNFLVREVWRWRSVLQLLSKKWETLDLLGEHCKRGHWSAFWPWAGWRGEIPSGEGIMGGHLGK